MRHWHVSALLVQVLHQTLLPAHASGQGPRRSRLPWTYHGWESFPTNWFGANPTGGLGGPGENNATLAVMTRHQLVGWGWQQGMCEYAKARILISD